MKTDDIRQRFLSFFAAKGHEVVPSASLVVANDPTLLFNNAGMVPFKEVFLGLETRPYLRAVSAQRCVRAGGKHNDLANVGVTSRHHTYFEMLGNFSFGDYFKEEAIRYAWEFLTQELGISPNKLWVTVFRDDQEAADLWLRVIGVDPQRLSFCDEADNFWSMGDTGPCGPCSEIFYDHGPGVSGGPPGSPDQDGDRFVEVWNLVFMQYNRDSEGHLHPLPKPSVDTGMGLERMAAVMQGVHDNYATDSFQAMFTAIREHAQGLDNLAMRVVADHMRATIGMMADGVLPSNEGRGYVLRRIMRRAMRFGYQQGLNQPFMHALVEPFSPLMRSAYPELSTQVAAIKSSILDEERSFAKALTRGLQYLNDAIPSLQGGCVSGELAFKLYDTFGFPIDLTDDFAKEHGLTVDHPGFEKALATQRQQSKKHQRFEANWRPSLPVDATVFKGYESLDLDSTIVWMGKDQTSVTDLHEGDRATVVLKATPFYAESGGQVADTGHITGEHGVFEVLNVQRQGDWIFHDGQVSQGSIALEAVNCRVDFERRQGIACHHSATHLLHAALRHVLGDHVEQQGSLVEPHRLRFDFKHQGALDLDHCVAIEQWILDAILANVDVVTEILSPSEAKARGALALFDEKYGDAVRALTMGSYSMELCGGTHVNRTGDIGYVRIVTQGAVAAGVRRIELVAGQHALAYDHGMDHLIHSLSQTLKTPGDQLQHRIEQLQAQLLELKHERDALRRTRAGDQVSDLLAKVRHVGSNQVLASLVEVGSHDELRSIADQLRNEKPDLAFFLGALQPCGKKLWLLAGVGQATLDTFSAPLWLKTCAKPLQGGGGGRPTFAQGAGCAVPNYPERIDDAGLWAVQQLTNP